MAMPIPEAGSSLRRALSDLIPSFLHRESRRVESAGSVIHPTTYSFMIDSYEPFEYTLVYVVAIMLASSDPALADQAILDRLVPTLHVIDDSGARVSLASATCDSPGYLLPATCYLLPVTCYLLPATCQLLPATFCYLLLSACCVVLGTCCVVLAAGYLLPAPYCLLLATCYLQPATCYLLPAT